MLFQVVEGHHVQGGRRYVKGDRVESASDLREVFPGKFQLVESQVVAKPSAGTLIRKDLNKLPIAAPEEVGDEELSLGPDEPVNVEIGEEDNSFPKATEAGLKVFKTKAGRYNVADSDLPDRILNTASMTKKELREFISKFSAPGGKEGPEEPAGFDAP